MADLDDLYGDSILDHCRHPRNHDRLESPDISGRAVNPFCGDEVILNLKLDPQGIIREAAFTGQGCSISQASGSMLAAILEGKTLEDAEHLSAIFRGMMQGQKPSEEELEKLGDLEALSGVRQFPIRIKCALLAWAILEDGIEHHRSQKR